MTILTREPIWNFNRAATFLSGQLQDNISTILGANGQFFTIFTQKERSNVKIGNFFVFYTFS